MESHPLPNILQSGSKLQSVLLTTSEVLPSPMTWQPAMSWRPAEDLTPFDHSAFTILTILIISSG